MHDFCFTIPYGLILIVGGLVGYAKKGSVTSLGGGAGAGLLLILAGFLSLKAFEKRKNSYLALILETVLMNEQHSPGCNFATWCWRMPH
ncbi:Protein FATTY ACID EXPORT 5 [Dionaea muscipula]